MDRKNQISFILWGSLIILTTMFINAAFWYVAYNIVLFKTIFAEFSFEMPSLSYSFILVILSIYSTIRIGLNKEEYKTINEAGGKIFLTMFSRWVSLGITYVLYLIFF